MKCRRNANISLWAFQSQFFGPDNFAKAFYKIEILLVKELSEMFPTQSIVRNLTTERMPNEI